MNRLILIIVLLVFFFCKESNEKEKLKTEILTFEKELKDLCNKKLDRVEITSKFDSILDLTSFGENDKMLARLGFNEKVMNQALKVLSNETDLFSRGEELFIFFKEEELLGYVIGTKMGCAFDYAEGTKNSVYYSKGDKLIFRRVESKEGLNIK